MNVCPKCGSGYIVGPRYVQSHAFSKEWLRYECGRCGYTDTTPTNDAKQASNPFAQPDPKTETP